MPLNTRKFFIVFHLHFYLSPYTGSSKPQQFYKSSSYSVMTNQELLTSNGGGGKKYVPEYLKKHKKLSHTVVLPAVYKADML